MTFALIKKKQAHASIAYQNSSLIPTLAETTKPTMPPLGSNHNRRGSGCDGKTSKQKSEKGFCKKHLVVCYCQTHPKSPWVHEKNKRCSKCKEVADLEAERKKKAKEQARSDESSDKGQDKDQQSSTFMKTGK